MILKCNFFLLLFFLTKQYGQLQSSSWKTFKLYPLCLFADEDEDAGDVDEDGPKVVLFVGLSKVLLSILEEQFELYTCPPRMGGHGTAVSQSS